jgi:hypothetical protein
MFDVCRLAGELTGTQCVAIPHQNERNLMLRENVVEAIPEGKFNVYAVKTIDGGLEILTSTPDGELDSNGEYPEGTVNHLIAKRLGVLDDSVRGYFQGLFASGGNVNPGKAKDSRTTKTPRSVSF